MKLEMAGREFFFVVFDSTAWRVSVRRILARSGSSSYLNDYNC